MAEELDNAVRLRIQDEVIAELERFGHYKAVIHVQNCKKRLMAGMEKGDPDAV